MECGCNKSEEKAVEQDFRAILDFSFKYCESENEYLASIAQEINARAFQVIKAIDRNCCVTKRSGE